MWQNWLLAIVGALVPILLGFLWKVNRVLNKMWDVMEEFPPHRHEKTKVFYPKGMKPEQPQELEEHSTAAHA